MRVFSKQKEYSVLNLLIYIFAYVIFLGFSLFLFFYLFLPLYTNQGETVTVPDLYGMHYEEMKTFLEKRDLRYELSDSTYSDQFPPLTVLKQYPKSGFLVKENRKIYVSLNRKTPPSLPMPELLDRSLQNAEAVLKSNELKRGKIEYVPSQFLNLVLKIKIDGKIVNAGERIKKGSVVDLVVGDGFEQSYFQTPELVGLDLSSTKLIILGSDLEIGLITFEGDSTLGSPVVIRQDPTAGTQIRMGNSVNLWVRYENN